MESRERERGGRRERKRHVKMLFLIIIIKHGDVTCRLYVQFVHGLTTYKWIQHSKLSIYNRKSQNANNAENWVRII